MLTSVFDLSIPHTTVLHAVMEVVGNPSVRETSKVALLVVVEEYRHRLRLFGPDSYLLKLPLMWS